MNGNLIACHVEGQSEMPDTYVVVSGDTLGSIAHALWGDRSLWYLLADANDVTLGPNDPLPQGEVGRAYRVPNEVAEERDNANTFTAVNF